MGQKQTSEAAVIRRLFSEAQGLGLITVAPDLRVLYVSPHAATVCDLQAAILPESLHIRPRDVRKCAAGVRLANHDQWSTVTTKCAFATQDAQGLTTAHHLLITEAGTPLPNSAQNETLNALVTVGGCSTR